MKRHVKRWHCEAVLAVLTSCALGAVAAQPDNKNAPTPPPPGIVQAWREAGAEMGWMNDVPPRTGTYRFWESWRDKAEPGSIPAFHFLDRDAGGAVVNLPDPGTPFGLDFHCGFYAGVALKELARFKRLPSLNN